MHHRQIEVSVENHPIKKEHVSEIDGQVVSGRREHKCDTKAIYTDKIVHSLLSAQFVSC